MTVFGRNTIGASNNAVNAGEGWITQFTAGASLTLTTMFVYQSGQVGTNVSVRLVIYADSANLPVGRIGSSAVIPIIGAVAAAWITSPLITPVSIVNGTKYWLEYDCVNNGGTSATRHWWGAFAGSTLASMTAGSDPVAGYSAIGTGNGGSIYATDDPIIVGSQFPRHIGPNVIGLGK